MELLKEKWASPINVVTLGATKEEGGTRDFKINVGGESALPYLLNEGEMPNKPAIAMEIWDMEPADWPPVLKEPFKNVLSDPVKWALKCVEEYKARILCIKLQGTHPDFGNKSAQDSAKLVRDILRAVKTPLIILGSGDDEKDNTVLSSVGEASKGERCLIGEATEKNYKTLAASCLADGHNIVAQSPIDINIAKQVNIMVNEMGLPLGRIVMNPTIGGLGYGIEYAYSIMERARLAALNGDSMLAMPFICLVGQEAWRAKEAKAETEEHPEWGDAAVRGPLWEFETAVAVLLSGADILVMRHPRAIDSVKKYIDTLMKQ